jgi:hypothetical protein
MLTGLLRSPLALSPEVQIAFTSFGVRPKISERERVVDSCEIDEICAHSLDLLPRSPSEIAIVLELVLVLGFSPSHPKPALQPG